MTANQLHLLLFFSFFLFNVFKIVEPNSEEMNKEFKVVWNVPIENCEGRFAVPLGLDKFNIIHNINGRFRGENMTIFYEPNFGKFPYIDDNGTYINGGLPQLGDIEAHRNYMIKDITAAIPNSDFKGFGVLDWEKWRPTWSMNFAYRQYQTESEKLVKSQHPDWTKGNITKEAIKQFEKAAREFMKMGLTVAQSLRPNGTWGYYQFPECVNHAALRRDCEPHAVKDNNKMQWLYNQSNALYPSIYVYGKSNTTVYAVNVWGKLNEPARVAANQNHYLPVYPYTILYYENLGDEIKFLTVNDLLATMGQSAAFKFSGVVIWGSWTATNTKEKCKNLQVYIKDILGPTIHRIQAVYAKNPNPLIFPASLPATEWSDKIIQYFS